MSIAKDLMEKLIRDLTLHEGLITNLNPKQIGWLASAQQQMVSTLDCTLLPS